MARNLFRLPVLYPGAVVRLDTDPSASSPADVVTVEQNRAIHYVSAESDGALGDVLGPDGVTTLYAKVQGTAQVITVTSATTASRTGGDTTLDPENVMDVVGLAVGPGLVYDDAADHISVRLSTDGGNTAQFGSDLGVYVPAVSSSGGGGGGAQGYSFSQSTPVTVWNVTHGLGFNPGGVTVIDTDGYVRDFGGVQYLTSGQSLRLSFDTALAGTAYLS